MTINSSFVTKLKGNFNKLRGSVPANHFTTVFVIINFHVSITTACVQTNELIS